MDQPYAPEPTPLERYVQYRFKVMADKVHQEREVLARLLEERHLRHKPYSSEATRPRERRPDMENAPFLTRERYDEHAGAPRETTGETSADEPHIQRLRRRKHD